MGLFDNLFLDQNTPVTINDGVDHSKDVTTPILHQEDVPNDDGKQAPQTASTEPKKDDSIADLFESDKKDEKEAEAKVDPKETIDVATEIGKGATVQASSETPETTEGGVSFDIGGDISFDTLSETTPDAIEIGKTVTVPGSEVSGIALEATSVPPETVAPPPEIGALGTETQSPVTNTTPTVAQEAPPANTDLTGMFLSTPDAGAPTGDGAALTSTENQAPALGGNILDLISGGSAPATLEVTPGTPEATSTESNPPIGESSVASSGTQDALGALAGIGTLPTQEIAPSASTDNILSQIGSSPIGIGETPSSSQSIGFSTGSTNTASSSSIDPMFERNVLSLFTRGAQSSTQLRDKLTNFVEELKMLHTHDQSMRNHKLEQIAMYEERIREIDLEAANRKRVLQDEIDDLRREIEAMDKEKSDIQEVLSSVQKELHVA